MSPAPADRDSLDHLPDDPVVLKRMLAELLEALHRRDHELQHLQQRMDQLLRRLYGPRAERFDPNQPLLFAVPSETPITAPEPSVIVDAEVPAELANCHRLVQLLH
jgi:transposase